MQLHFEKINAYIQKNEKMKQIFKSKPIFRKIKTENDILKYTAKMKTNSPSEHNSNHFIVQVISLHDCFGSQKKKNQGNKVFNKNRHHSY